MFKFNMLDGSQYIIENLVSSDKETFSKGIELMKKNGVRFVDSYHLLDIIRSNKNLDQYIVAIEKEKKHDFSYFKALPTNRTTYSTIL